MGDSDFVLGVPSWLELSCLSMGKRFTFHLDILISYSDLVSVESKLFSSLSEL